MQSTITDNNFAVFLSCGYKDFEDFQRTKKQVWEAARSGKEINLSELKPIDYKYFAELYYLYYDMEHGNISKEQAVVSERKLYEEYTAQKDTEMNFLAMKRQIEEMQKEKKQ